MDSRAEKLWQRGIVHFRQGNMAAAQASFEAFLAREPGSGPGLFRLSMVEARRGRYRKAIDFAEQALQADPGRTEALTHLARCHVNAGHLERARAAATQALAQPRGNSVALDALGVVMTRLDEQDAALELFDLAIRQDSNQASIYFNRALANRQFDRIEAAAADLESCLALQPGHAKAHWILANLRGQDLAGNHLPRLRQRLALASAGEREAVALALFKELDDLGETAEATDLLTQTIRERAARLPLAGAGDEHAALVRALVKTCDERFVRRRADARTENGPVFVVGFPRSGVALLSQRLSRHPRLLHLGAQAPFPRLLAAALGFDGARPPRASELPGLAGFDFDAFGHDYLADVTPAGSKPPILCESHPLNYLEVGFIARALPGARFLHVVRDPVDSCVSLLAQPGPEPLLAPQAPAALAACHHDYQRLMQHWHEVLPGRMMDVSYESLVEKPEMILRVICSFLGIRYASSLRMGLQLHGRSLGRGHRYLDALPGLKTGLAVDARQSRSA